MPSMAYSAFDLHNVRVRYSQTISSIAFADNIRIFLNMSVFRDGTSKSVITKYSGNIVMMVGSST